LVRVLRVDVAVDDVADICGTRPMSELGATFKMIRELTSVGAK
jgi:hypothetical protein